MVTRYAYVLFYRRQNSPVERPPRFLVPGGAESPTAAGATASQVRTSYVLIKQSVGLLFGNLMTKLIQMRSDTHLGVFPPNIQHFEVFVLNIDVFQMHLPINVVFLCIYSTPWLPSLCNFAQNCHLFS